MAGLGCPVTTDFNRYDREQTRLEREEEWRDDVGEKLDLIRQLVNEPVTPITQNRIKYELGELKDLIRGGFEEW